MQIKKIIISLYEKVYSSNLALSIMWKIEHINDYVNIMNPKETIKYIINNQCSISRFGDGEFELILEPDINLKFQNNSNKLAEKLEEVLKNNNRKLLICIPYSFNSFKGRTNYSRKFWYNWGGRNNQYHRIISIIKKYKNNSYIFGDSQITRPYIAYSTNKNAKQIFTHFKDIWKDKDLLIVEGEKTRLGVGNDLFDNTKSIKRILAPAVNAFESYNQILKSICDVYNGELVLIALGPTATILASDLADNGIWAIDLGHIDIEYEWYLSKSKEHTIVKGKFTNEAENGDIVDEFIDEKYINSIILKIGGSYDTNRN